MSVVTTLIQPGVNIHGNIFRLVAHVSKSGRQRSRHAVRA